MKDKSVLHVYKYVEAKIRDQEWGPNQKIPIESALAKETGTSRGAVRSALKKARDDGLIEPNINAQGWHVRPFLKTQFTERLSEKLDLLDPTQMDQKHKERLTEDTCFSPPTVVTCFDLAGPPLRLSAADVRTELRLGDEFDTLIMYFGRIRYTGSPAVPYALQWVAFPFDLVGRKRIPFSDVKPGGTTHYLENVGLKRTQVKKRFSGTSATSKEAEALDLNIGDGLLQEIRISSCKVESELIESKEILPAQLDQNGFVNFEYSVTLFSPKTEIIYEISQD